MNSPVSESGSTLKACVVLGLFVALSVGLFGADQWLKVWSFERLAMLETDDLVRHATDEQFYIPYHNAIPLVPSVLSLKLTLNHGAVFGLGQGGRWWFVLITFFALGIIGYAYYTSYANQWGFRTMLAVILAGALGNLYDRMLIGAVRDMLWLFPEVKLPFGLSWPSGDSELYPWIFNLADVYLCVGIVMVLIMSFISGDPQAATAKVPAQEPESSS